MILNVRKTRRVKRLGQPPSLKKNASHWKRELLLKIEECKKDGSKVPKKFYEKYKQDDVMETLNKMYRGYCCYCEKRVKNVGYGNIEHRKPKDKYPQFTFSWANLHLACEKCNRKKSIKYSEQYPIIDAVRDSLSEHRTYMLDRHGLWWVPKSKRGRTTEGHADLNREELREERMEIFLGTISLIRKINKDPSAPDAEMELKRLEEMSNREYGSVVCFAIESYLK